MIPPLDIFRVEADHLVWRGAAETLDLARLRVKLLMVSEPADYMIFNQRTGRKTLIKAHDLGSEII
jgi:hypothetical protein